MDKKDLIDKIIDYLNKINPKVNSLNDKTKLLEEVIDFDSLDLAGLISYLEEETNLDPFQDGFIEFESIEELAILFTEKSN